MSYQFASFSPQMALQLVYDPSTASVSPISEKELSASFNPYDLKRLDLYSRNMADYHLVTDLLPSCEH